MSEKQLERSLRNEDRIYLTSQEIHDLYCLALQSRIDDNFYLLSFGEVMRREFPAYIDKETMLLNGVLGIPVQKKGVMLSKLL